MGRTLIAGLALCAVSGLLVTTPVSAQDQPARTDRRVLKGMHEQLRFDKDVSRTAVGDQKILSADALDSKTLLLLGRESGRTSLLVWFADNTMQAFDVTVQPDLGLLQRALQDIHPNITVEMAPDRPAVVLRGTVPDVVYSRNAETAAAAYLRAERGVRTPTVAAQPAGGTEAQAPTVQPIERSSDKAQASVINLIRVESLPKSMEHRIEDAIHHMGASDVTVERLVKGEAPDDQVDVILLRGKVRDQVGLTRVLQVASTMVGGHKEGKFAEDIQVTTDESGGLPSRRNENSSGSSSGGGGGGGGFSGTSGSTGFGNTDLENAIEANPGRAKSVSVADGRVLSFIEVEDLPQVRVDVRVYEVNRTELMTYAPQLVAIFSDFNQPSLQPAGAAVDVQGAQAARVGGTGSDEVQNVVGFLERGFSNQFQYAGKHIAIDSVMQILENRGIARSLSNPSLTVLSGEDANFGVGGEVPIPQAFTPAFGSTTTAGTTTPGVFNSVEFRRFGVGLSMRPLVGDDGKLTLDLFSTISEPDAVLTTLIRDTTGTDPATTAFQTRAIETTARLKDGQALMIGGLIGRRSGDDTSYTPWLESIPLVGWLFKRFAVRDEDREIVIVVNPTVVRDPIPELGIWTFPDVSQFSRRWVDSMIDFGMNKWPRKKEGSK
jgi:pilus assembly protein CpaC